MPSVILVDPPTPTHRLTVISLKHGAAARLRQRRIRPTVSPERARRKRKIGVRSAPAAQTAPPVTLTRSYASPARPLMAPIRRPPTSRPFSATPRIRGPSCDIAAVLSACRLLRTEIPVRCAVAACLPPWFVRERRASSRKTAARPIHHRPFGRIFYLVHYFLNVK